MHFPIVLNNCNIIYINLFILLPVLKQQFIAKRVLFLADWFRQPSKEALAKGLRRVCEAFAKGLKSICKGFEKRLTRFGNRLTGVCKWFEKCLKCFPSVCEEFAKGLQSV